MPAESDLPERRYPARPSWQHHHNRSVIVFLTICTKNRVPLLAEPTVHRLIISAWDEADSWLVGRYVILPDHMHLFAAPASPDSPDLRKWIAYWKSIVSRRWPQGMGRLQWQRDAWDRQLRTGDSYSAKWDYIRENPVRHSLAQRAEDWPYQGERHLLAWHD